MPPRREPSKYDSRIDNDESIPADIREPRTVALACLVYAICLAGASYNHARIALDHGLTWNYGGLPAFVSVFWTALTFIDPLAAILLMTKPLPGLSLTAAIIVSDVLINAWVGMTYGFDIASFAAQALFLAFVMSTVGIAWRAESGAPLRRRAL